MKLNQYSLTSGFGQWFFEKNNTETIWQVEYVKGKREHGWDAANHPNAPWAQGDAVGICPTQELVDAFPMINGKTITDPTSGYNPDDPYVDRDPRLDETEAVQFDYSNRQWSGLIRGYYKPRWEMFFEFLRSQKNDASRYSEKDLEWSYDRPAHYANEFYSKMSDWEKNWIEQTESYPDKPQGNPIQIARELYEKWSKVAMK